MGKLEDGPGTEPGKAVVVQAYGRYAEKCTVHPFVDTERRLLSKLIRVDQSRVTSKRGGVPSPNGPVWLCKALCRLREMEAGWRYTVEELEPLRGIQKMDHNYVTKCEKFCEGWFGEVDIPHRIVCLEFIGDIDLTNKGEGTDWEWETSSPLIKKSAFEEGVQDVWR